MKRYNHLVDLGFEIETDSEFDDLNIGDLLQAAYERVDFLKSHPDEAKEAFGLVDSFVQPDIHSPD
jgi:hypothetical protein